MQIIPTAKHVLLSDYDPASNESQTQKLNKMTLGEAAHPLWDKKFKIRVTSNNTGRKIDFNVLFNLIKKKTKEEMM